MTTTTTLKIFICAHCGAMKSSSTAPKRCHECNRDAMEPYEAPKENTMSEEQKIEERRERAWNRIRFQGGLLIPMNFIPEEHRETVRAFLDSEESKNAKQWSRKVWENVLGLRRDHPQFRSALKALLSHLEHYQARDGGFMFEGLRSTPEWYQAYTWNRDATRRLLRYLSNKLKKSRYQDVFLTPQGYLVWSWKQDSRGDNNS